MTMGTCWWTIVSSCKGVACGGTVNRIVGTDKSSLCERNEGSRASRFKVKFWYEGSDRDDYSFRKIVVQFINSTFLYNGLVSIYAIVYY